MKIITLHDILSHKITTMETHETIAKALNIMSYEGISSVVIVDKNSRPIGIFTEHDALKIVADSIDTERMIDEVMTHEPFSVIHTMQMHDAYALMEEKKFRHMIVTDEEGVFAGVVTEGDFLRHIGLDHLTQFKKVHDAMSDSPLLVEMQTNVSDAALLMKERHCDYAIVLDGTHPVGIVTERDIVRRMALKTSVNVEKVEDLIQLDIRLVLKDVPLHEAASMMEEHGVHQLIVVDEYNNLAGLLTRHDLLHAVHGAYFEYLMKVIDQKSAAIARMHQRKKELIEQKKAVEMSTIKLRAIFEALPDGLLVIDTETLKAVEFNRAAHEQLGYSAEEFASLSVHDYEAIENPVEIMERAKILQEKGQDTFETLHKKKNGDLIHVWVNVIVLKLEDRPYILTVFRDITELKEAQDSLIESRRAFEQQNNFLHTLLNAIPDLIWFKDLEGVYSACNRMFERFFGAKSDEIIGKTDFNFVSAELAQFFREHDLAAIDAGGSKTNEEYLTFGDGSYEGYFETIKTPMYDSDGGVIGVLGVARDISERKRRDQELSQVESLAKIGTWEWEASNNMFRGSKEAYRLFGFEPSDTISFLEVLEKISIEDREKVIMQFSSPSSDERHVGSVYKIIPREGETRWLRTHTDFIYDGEKLPLKAVGIVQDITEQVEYENRLETLANYDPLTGLANRGLLQTHLQNAITQAKRHKTQVGLLMFDLDRFKDINDSYGHIAGDELLQVVAQRFSSRLREGDIISRLGGDEFAVVLEHLSRPEDAGRLAEEMIAALGAEYRLSSGAMIHIGSSAGIVLFPDHGEDSSELLQHADAALYKAKAEGRGIYHYYTDELTALARQRIEFETRLRRAIVNQEFEVYYQPQVHIATGRIVGAEALIRWNCPERGRVSPVEFIPIAEETGLIGEIGEWVLNETCRQGKIWLDQGHRLTLAVNLSAHQVRHQNIPLMVENALKKSGYPADRLELELTESALMQREEETVEMLHALRAHGIRLAIDDFGTGYSSLSYLKRFPIDVLKIDKSFVDDIPFENDDMAIVTAIIAMGQALGFQVLAEGTEREEQIAFLKEKGCTMYQGYFKSPPVPAEAFEKLL